MVQSQKTFISPFAAACSDPRLSPKPSLKRFFLPTSHDTHPPFLLSVPISEFILFCMSEGAKVKRVERRGKGVSSEVVHTAKHLLLGETSYRSRCVLIPAPSLPPCWGGWHPTLLALGCQTLQMGRFRLLGKLAAWMTMLYFLLGRRTGRDKSIPQSRFSPQPQMSRLEVGL